MLMNRSICTYFVYTLLVIILSLFLSLSLSLSHSLSRCLHKQNEYERRLKLFREAG